MGIYSYHDFEPCGRRDDGKSFETRARNSAASEKGESPLFCMTLKCPEDCSQLIISGRRYARNTGRSTLLTLQSRYAGRSGKFVVPKTLRRRARLQLVMPQRACQVGIKLAHVRSRQDRRQQIIMIIGDRMLE